MSPKSSSRSRKHKNVQSALEATSVAASSSTRNEADRNAANEVERNAANEVERNAANEVERNAANEVERNAANEVERNAANEVERNAANEIVEPSATNRLMSRLIDSSANMLNTLQSFCGTAQAQVTAAWDTAWNRVEHNNEDHQASVAHSLSKIWESFICHPSGDLDDFESNEISATSGSVSYEASTSAVHRNNAASGSTAKTQVKKGLLGKRDIDPNDSRQNSNDGELASPQENTSAKRIKRQTTDVTESSSNGQSLTAFQDMPSTSHGNAEAQKINSSDSELLPRNVTVNSLASPSREPGFRDSGSGDNSREGKDKESQTSSSRLLGKRDIDPHQNSNEENQQESMSAKRIKRQATDVPNTSSNGQGPTAFQDIETSNAIAEERKITNWHGNADVSGLSASSRVDHMTQLPGPGLSEEDLHNMYPCILPRYHHMRSQDDRLETMVQRMPGRFNAKRMSEAGFFLGPGNRICCWYCACRFDESWDSNEDPFVLHAKGSPRCEYLLRTKGPWFVEAYERPPRSKTQPGCDMPGSDNLNTTSPPQFRVMELEEKPPDEMGMGQLPQPFNPDDSSSPSSICAESNSDATSHDDDQPCTSGLQHRRHT